MGYNNGKIYRIVCNVSGKQYIGSTTQPLSKRLSQHKGKFNMWKDGKYGYAKSFDIIENGDYGIVLIEDYPCKSKNELERRERYFIETMECVNKILPAPTEEERIEQKKQYYKENKEQYKERSRQYYEENKEKLKEQMKQYREEKKEQINEQKKQYREGNKEKLNEKKKQYYQENKEQYKERSRQYREENKEKIQDYFKQYREENKEKLKQYREENKEKLKQRCDCECGGKYTHINESRHLKTKKHQQWEQQQTTTNQP